MGDIFDQNYFDNKTVKQLKQFCSENGIKVYGKKNKKQMLEYVKQKC